MPTYQYQCTECGEDLEAVQKFTDESLTECPSCEGRLRKVFSAVGVVFKGSGFYRNDSRSASSGDGPAATKSTEGKNGDSSKSAGDSATKSSSTSSDSSGSSKSASSDSSSSGSSSSSKSSSTAASASSGTGSSAA